MDNVSCFANIGLHQLTCNIFLKNFDDFQQVEKLKRTSELPRGPSLPAPSGAQLGNLSDSPPPAVSIQYTTQDKFTR